MHSDLVQMTARDSWIHCEEKQTNSFPSRALSRSGDEGLVSAHDKVMSTPSSIMSANYKQGNHRTSTCSRSNVQTFMEGFCSHRIHTHPKYSLMVARVLYSIQQEKLPSPAQDGLWHTDSSTHAGRARHERHQTHFLATSAVQHDASWY